MTAVGIDVSKQKSMVAVLDSYGTVLVNPFTDVTESDYCCNAAIWAADAGVLKSRSKFRRSENRRYRFF